VLSSHPSSAPSVAGGPSSLPQGRARQTGSPPPAGFARGRAGNTVVLHGAHAPGEEDRMYIGIGTVLVILLIVLLLVFVF